MILDIHLFLPLLKEISKVVISYMQNLNFSTHYVVFLHSLKKTRGFTKIVW